MSKPHEFHINGERALIDEEDIEMVARYGKWHTNNGYVRKRGRGKWILLHRLIMGVHNDTYDYKNLVDHINGDRLDNRKCNLRICTMAQNGMNRKPWKGANSMFKGVYRSGSFWYASIRIQGKRIYLGTHKTQEEAAKAYREAAAVHHGKYAFHLCK
jgi:hypothetical protein